MALSNGSQSEDASLAESLDNLFAGLPPDTLQAIRLAALPHQLTDDQLALLLAVEQQTQDTPAITVADVRAVLISTRLAYDNNGAVNLRPAIRELLRVWWRQSAPTRFNELNRLLLDSLCDRAAGSPDPNDAAIVYHRLLADEESGRSFLMQATEAALDYFQLEQAEFVIAAARAAEAALSTVTRAWLEFYDARLAMVARRGDRGSATFARLANATTPRDLQAVVLWSSGQLSVQAQNWQQGIALQRNALAMLPSAVAPIYRGRIQLTIGDAYRDLAENMGGLAADRTHQRPSSPAARFAEFPYLVYRRLVRRFSFLPNWYFGGNYEDWAIAYLQKQATRWYRRAAEAASAVGAELPKINAELANANLLHRLGRWRQARLLLQRLKDQSTIQNSRYRTAKLQYIEGEALAVERDWTTAGARLAVAAETFRAYSDIGSLAVTLHWLGRVQRFTVPEQAAATYAESTLLYAATGDLTTATLALGELESTLPGHELDVAVRRELPALHYLTRFPDAFLRRARRLALFVALPVSIFAGLILVLLAYLITAHQEGIIRLALANASFAALDVNDFIIVGMFWFSPVLALWLYQGIYCGVGYAMISVSGRRITPIEQQPPDRIELTENELTYVGLGEGAITRLRWATIGRVVSLEHRWRQQTVHLFSRIFLADHHGDTVDIHAVTIGYGHLKRELEWRLASVGRSAVTQFDFELTSLRAVAATVLLTCLRLVATVPTIDPDQISLRQPDGSVVMEFAYLSPWLRELLLAFPLIFLAITMWRLVWRRKSWRRVAPEMPPLTPTWLLWLIALALTAFIALTWFGFSDR